MTNTQLIIDIHNHVMAFKYGGASKELPPNHIIVDANEAKAFETLSQTGKKMFVLYRLRQEYKKFGESGISEAKRRIVFDYVNQHDNFEGIYDPLVKATIDAPEMVEDLPKTDAPETVEDPPKTDVPETVEDPPKTDVPEMVEDLPKTKNKGGRPSNASKAAKAEAFPVIKKATIDITSGDAISKLDENGVNLLTNHEVKTAIKILVSENTGFVSSDIVTKSIAEQKAALIEYIKIINELDIDDK